MWEWSITAALFTPFNGFIEIHTLIRTHSKAQVYPYTYSITYAAIPK